MRKKPVVCLDRDGTLIYDTREHLYLGHDEDWRGRVRLLPKVVEGVKLLRTIPEVALYMVTNQPGVAIRDFPRLTRERAHEVCRYVLEALRERGAPLDGYFLCPHASPEYVREYPQYGFREELVCRCACIKPALGMVFDALASEGLSLKEARLAVIGDRATDVETALRAGGTGILIPFINQPGEDEKVKGLTPRGRVHIAPDMQEAARFLLSRGPC
ncbi:MAG: HAD-IIIA family hydrolase [Nitrospirota bacterium]